MQKRNIDAEIWLAGFSCITLSVLIYIVVLVVAVDPFFHYHRPNDSYYYELDNERSQNRGVCRFFDYNGIIIGSSMVENFKTSEMDQLFKTKAIKVPYSGGSYKETGDTLRVALESNDNVDVVIRCVDMSFFLYEKDWMRTDLGDYPYYLYDANPFNDINYIFNKDVVFKRVFPMLKNRAAPGFVPGITSFDEAFCWQEQATFGKQTVYPDTVEDIRGTALALTEEDRTRLRANVQQNLTLIADEYPTVTFYYFFPPYSVLWWNDLLREGTFDRQLEAERCVIELLLEHENIKLFSFNSRIDITSDLNNYKDIIHYGAWINSLILNWLSEGKYQLTRGNYEDYLMQERALYANYAYENINAQKDYENDMFAAALLNGELSGAAPIRLLTAENINLDLQSVEMGLDEDGKSLVMRCTGTLDRAPDSLSALQDYLQNTGFIGARIELPDIRGKRFLSFHGKKETANGQPCVMAFDREGKLLSLYYEIYSNLDDNWHQYLLELNDIADGCEIIFNGGYVDQTGDPGSCYLFRDIVLY